jgi:phosphatidylinositol dimannoside acyltransferase
VSWRRRLSVRGVLWRHFLRWAVLNVPPWILPAVKGFWSLFFLLWGPGRRGVMRNLGAILPGSSRAANFLRTYRVFWNFASVMEDNVRFKEQRVSPDWEFAGLEHFERMLAEPHGAIILTAHMGNYDLGAHVFAETSDRRLVMVRAPETDAETRQYEEDLNARTIGDRMTIDFSTRSSELALDLLHALQRGDIIAIQGDRVTPGVAPIEATLFGKRLRMPAGPFALAMAARVRIYPLFIIRLGYLRYRLLTAAPIEVVRTRDRAEVFERAVQQWTDELERAIRAAWFQWFTFEPYSEELAA